MKRIRYDKYRPVITPQNYARAESAVSIYRRSDDSLNFLKRTDPNEYYKALKLIAALDEYRESQTIEEPKATPEPESTPIEVPSVETDSTVTDTTKTPAPESLDIKTTTPVPESTSTGTIEKIQNKAVSPEDIFTERKRGEAPVISTTDKPSLSKQQISVYNTYLKELRDDNEPYPYEWAQQLVNTYPNDPYIETMLVRNLPKFSAAREYILQYKPGFLPTADTVSKQLTAKENVLFKVIQEVKDLQSMTISTDNAEYIEALTKNDNSFSVEEKALILSYIEALDNTRKQKLEAEQRTKTEGESRLSDIENIYRADVRGAYFIGRWASEFLEKPVYGTTSFALRGVGLLTRIKAINKLADMYNQPEKYGIVTPTVTEYRQEYSRRAYDVGFGQALMNELSESGVDVASFLMSMYFARGMFRDAITGPGDAVRSVEQLKTLPKYGEKGYRLSQMANMGKDVSFLAGYKTITTPGTPEQRVKSGIRSAMYSSTPYFVNITGATGNVATLMDITFNTLLSTPDYINLAKETGNFEDFMLQAIPSITLDIAMALQTKGDPWLHKQRTDAKARADYINSLKSFESHMRYRYGKGWDSKLQTAAEGMAYRSMFGSPEEGMVKIVTEPEKHKAEFDAKVIEKRAIVDKLNMTRYVLEVATNGKAVPQINPDRLTAAERSAYEKYVNEFSELVDDVLEWEVTKNTLTKEQIAKAKRLQSVYDKLTDKVLDRETPQERSLRETQENEIIKRLEQRILQEERESQEEKPIIEEERPVTEERAADETVKPDEQIEKAEEPIEREELAERTEEQIERTEEPVKPTEEPAPKEVASEEKPVPEEKPVEEKPATEEKTDTQKEAKAETETEKATEVETEKETKEYKSIDDYTDAEQKAYANNTEEPTLPKEQGEKLKKDAEQTANKEVSITEKNLIKYTKRVLKGLIQQTLQQVGLASYKASCMGYDITRALKEKGLPAKDYRAILPFIIEHKDGDPIDLPVELKNARGWGNKAYDIRNQLFKDYIEGKSDAVDTVNEIISQVREFYNDEFDVLRAAYSLSPETYKENYVNRIWRTRKRTGLGFRTVTPHALERVFDTMRDGIAAGYLPETTDINDLLSRVSRSNASAISNRRFEQAIKSMTDAEGKPVLTTEKSDDVVLINEQRLWKLKFSEVTTATRKTLSTLFVDIMKELGITINPKRGGDVKGTYNTRTGEMKLAPDFDKTVITHEIGHALQQRFGITDEFFNIYKAELEELNRDRVDSFTTDKGKRYASSNAEMFAELVSAVLVDTERAFRLAPEASKVILDKLSDDAVTKKLVGFDYDANIKQGIKQVTKIGTRIPVYASPSTAAAINLVYGKSFIDSFPVTIGNKNYYPLRALRNISWTIKQSALSWSGFLGLMMSETSAGQPKVLFKTWNPAAIKRALSEGVYPLYEKENRHIMERAISYGLKVPGTTTHGETRSPLFDWTVDLSKNIPVARETAEALATLDTAFNKMTFDYFQGSFKMYAFNELAKAIDRNPKLKDVDKEVYLRQAAQVVNDFYSGQQWEKLGVSRNWKEALDLVMFAPDYNVSAVRQALAITGIGSAANALDPTLYGIEPGTPEYDRVMSLNAKARREIGGRLLIKTLAMLTLFYNATNALFRYIDHKNHPELYEEGFGEKFDDYCMWNNSPGFSRYLFLCRNKDGKEMYARIGKQFTDPIVAATDPIQVLGSKAGPLVQAGSITFTGVTMSGYKTEAFYEREPLEKAFAIAKEIAKMPIPITLTSLYEDNQTVSPVRYVAPVKEVHEGMATRLLADSYIDILKSRQKGINVDIQNHPGIHDAYVMTKKNKMNWLAVIENGHSMAVNDIKNDYLRNYSKNVRSAKRAVENAKTPQQLFDAYKLYNNVCISATISEQFNDDNFFDYANAIIQAPAILNLDFDSFQRQYGTDMNRIKEDILHEINSRKIEKQVDRKVIRYLKEKGHTITRGIKRDTNENTN